MVSKQLRREQAAAIEAARDEEQLLVEFRTMSRAKAHIRQDEEVIVECVMAARYLGATWQQVGLALGITMQSAQSAFRKFEGDTPGVPTPRVPARPKVPSRRKEVQQKLPV
jgi:hypothetical protein